MPLPIVDSPCVFPGTMVPELGLEPGWYFRPANCEQLEGPFASREEARSFALEALSGSAPPTSDPLRRAA